MKKEEKTKIIGGINIIPSHSLPPFTMYVSMDIYEYMINQYKVEE